MTESEADIARAVACLQRARQMIEIPDFEQWSESGYGDVTTNGLYELIVDALRALDPTCPAPQAR